MPTIRVKCGDGSIHREENIDIGSKEDVKKIIEKQESEDIPKAKAKAEEL